jgi:hypothetical protein
VVAHDNAGDGALTYTWSVVTWSGGTAGASGASFSPNSSSAAANATVQFAHSGTYTLRVTVRDHQGNATDSTTAALTVTATASSVHITETAPSVAAGGTLVLHGGIRDQFNDALTGTVTWSILPGGAGGIIAPDGTFTAPTTDGTTVVQVSDGTHTTTVTVTVTRVIPGIVINGGDDHGGGGCGLGTASLACFGGVWLCLRRRRIGN